MSKQQKQAGFTLVELAIVMIIIGLLIAGVLKGQQLIANARVTSTVAQVKGIDGATSTFRDMYNGIPGDLANAATRLKNCAGSPICNAAAGDGNGQIGTAPTAASGTEARAFFPQLSLADLLTGINTAAATGSCATIGNCYPEAKTANGGALKPGYFGGGALGPAANTNAAAGTYLTLMTLPEAAVTTAAGAQALTPNQAQRIDTKIDDGLANTGSVVYQGATGCVAGTAGSQTYAEGTATNECGLFIRIQG